MTQLVVNFYRFIQLGKPQEICDHLQKSLSELSILGTITIAPEGLNGGLAGDRTIVCKALSIIRKIESFKSISVRESYGKTEAYHRLDIRVKDRILAFPEHAEPDMDDIKSSPSLSPNQWLELIKNLGEKAVILDTRNGYEFEQGSFQNAQQLDIERFQEFPDAFLEKYKHQKDRTFLMFCTGGIRCEKAAAFARKEGFSKVYKLEGGVIQYFKENGADGWKGNCFVFDNRAAIEPSREESPWSFPNRKISK